MQRLRHTGLGMASLASVLAAALLAQPCVAQESPVRFRLARAITWDANVFRVSDSVSDPLISRGVRGRSDRITATTVGLNIDKSYSQQQLLLDLSQTATRYGKFNNLDLDAFAYRAAWQWHLSPRISGSFSADRNETLVDFVDVRGVQRISRVTTTRGVNVDGWLFGGWHLLAGASQLERKNGAVFLAQPSISQTTTHYGLKYFSPALSSIGYTTRMHRGTNTDQAVDLVNFIDSGFTMREDELSATWIASGRSTLNGRLTRTERRQPNVPQRDFVGVGGELLYAWTPTGSVGVNLSAARSVTPFQGGLDSTYRVDNIFTLAPTLQLSAHTILRLNASRRVTDFLGPVTAASGASRRDVYRVVEVGANWLPHRRIALDATLRRETRTSSVPGFDFVSTVAGVTGTLTF